MGGDLARGVGDVHDLGRRGAVLPAELAVAEPEVQRRPGHDDQVGLAEGDRPGPGDQQLVPGGQDAAALAVGDDRQPQLPRRRRGRPGCAPSSHTSEPRTSTGRLARASSPAIAAIAAGSGGVRAADGARRPPGRRGPAPRSAGSGRRGGTGRAGRPNRASRLMSRNTGPRCRAAASPNASSDRPADAGRGVLGPGPLGDRAEQRGMVELLQAARAPAVVGRAAGRARPRASR